MKFKYVPGHHTGEALGDEVLEILKQFEIAEKLFCITTDNASNNGRMMKHISRRLKDEFNIMWDGSEHHIACMNHIINLAVQDFLKGIKSLAPDDDDEEKGNEED